MKGIQHAIVSYIPLVIAVLILSISSYASDASESQGRNLYPFSSEHEQDVEIRWSNPSIQGNALTGIWGDNKNLYAVGELGTVLSFKGDKWHKIETNYNYWLSDIWGFKDNSIFICGYNGAVLEYRDDRWKLHNTSVTNDLNGIWGTSPQSVFAVGDRGTILYFNGTKWEKMVSGSDNLLFDIWGISKDYVYAVGGRGTILKWDGVTWKQIEGITSKEEHLISIWGNNDDVYVGSNNGSIFHYHNTSSKWEKILSPISEPIRAITGYKEHGFVALAEPAKFIFFDGTNDTKVIHADTLPSGGNGTIWKIKQIDEYGVMLRAMWINNNGLITTVGDSGAIFTGRDSNDVWEKVNRGVLTNINTIAKTNINSSNISERQDKRLYPFTYLAGGEGAKVVMYNNKERRWDDLIDIPFSNNITKGIHDSTLPLGTIRKLLAVGEKGIIAAGDSGNIAFYNNKIWERYPSTGETIYTLWEDTYHNNRIYAAGDNGYLGYLNGDAWIKLNLFTNTSERQGGNIHSFKRLRGIYGSSDYIYTIGDSGTIIRISSIGNSVEVMDVPTMENLFSINGNGSKDIYVVGDYGTILTLQGDKWIKVISPTRVALRAVAVLNTNIILIGGDEGLLFIRYKDTWKKLPQITSNAITDFCIKDNNSIFAVGNSGTILDISIR